MMRSAGQCGSRAHCALEVIFPGCGRYAPPRNCRSAQARTAPPWLSAPGMPLTAAGAGGTLRCPARSPSAAAFPALRIMRAKGFTLIEVLVALAIVTIGMSAVLEALTSSAGAALYLRSKTFAEWTALNQLERTRLRAELTGQIPQAGISTGHSRNAGRRWHWRQKVVKTLVPGVERIVVNVRPASGHGKDWYATVTGYVGNKMAIPSPSVPPWGESSLGAPAHVQPLNGPLSRGSLSGAGLGSAATP